MASVSSAAPRGTYVPLDDVQAAWCQSCASEDDALRVRAAFKAPGLVLQHNGEGGWPVGALPCNFFPPNSNPSCTSLTSACQETR